MRRITVTTSAVIAVFTAASLLYASEQAETAYARGQQQLQQADLDGALKSFSEAVKADRTNLAYREAFAILKQVRTLRSQLDQETDKASWDYIAKALHTYYLEHKVYDEAVALDRKIHERWNNATSATMLAETQLALNRSSHAAEVLGSLDQDQQTVSTRALYGLALVRAGEEDQGRQVAAELQLADDAGPGPAYSVARLQAALGNQDQALALLRRTFEGIAPSRLAGFKYHAAHSPEFAKLATTADFQAVMKTESKVHESQCSGGSSCATCPMRGQCSGDQ